MPLNGLKEEDKEPLIELFVKVREGAPLAEAAPAPRVRGRGGKPGSRAPGPLSRHHPIPIAGVCGESLVCGAAPPKASGAPGRPGPAFPASSYGAPPARGATAFPSRSRKSPPRRLGPPPPTTSPEAPDGVPGRPQPGPERPG